MGESQTGGKHWDGRARAQTAEGAARLGTRVGAFLHEHCTPEPVFLPYHHHHHSSKASQLERVVYYAGRMVPLRLCAHSQGAGWKGAAADNLCCCIVDGDPEVSHIICPHLGQTEGQLLLGSVRTSPGYSASAPASSLSAQEGS